MELGRAIGWVGILDQGSADEYGPRTDPEDAFLGATGSTLADRKGRFGYLGEHPDGFGAQQDFWRGRAVSRRRQNDESEKYEGQQRAKADSDNALVNFSHLVIGHIAPPSDRNRRSGYHLRPWQERHTARINADLPSPDRGGDAIGQPG
jgi:hypothetical protein